MAGSKTNAFEDRFLDFVFKNNANGTPLSTPGNSIYVALYTVVPSDSSNGTEVPGATGSTGYARQQVTAANWTHSAGSNTVTNTADILFPTVATAAYTVLGWAILDAVTGGNMLYWGDTASTLMSIGDVPRLAAGAVTITED